jgi:hypothetical protein
VQILGAVLAQQGIALGKDPTGKPPGPDHQPLLGFLESQRRMEPAFVAIKERYHLSWQAAAEAAAAAAGVIIHWCAGVLDPNIAFNLAVYGFVEGAKTAPDPLHPQ